MPFTPFHFGPGAAIHSAAPARISFLAFAAVNVLIDCETLYFIVTKQYPLHRFLHTYLGTNVAILGTVLAFALLRPAARRWPVLNLWHWADLPRSAVLAGALLGAYSHVLLDSIMHSDVRPLAPFSDANAMLAVVPSGTLHRVCVVAAVVGLLVLGLRRWMGRGEYRNV